MHHSLLDHAAEDTQAVLAAHTAILSHFGGLVDRITADQVERYRTYDGDVAELPPEDADPIEYPRPMGVTPVEG